MNTTLMSFTKPVHFFPQHQLRHLQSLVLLGPIKSSSGRSNNTTSSNDAGGDSPSPPPVTPPETVQIRFRRGSRKRSKQKQEDGGVVSGGLPKRLQPPAPKDWESMTLTEKAIELYVGEKGLLFWINKFAYASIFIVIGAWILFRFVGPAFNLYQLDTPPLSPSTVLNG